MKHTFLLTLFMLITACFSQDEESSDVIFNDTVVNRYRINFYVADWDSILEYNKENGEVYMGAQFIYYRPNGDSIVLENIGVRYKGNSSYTFSGASPKKPLKFDFDQYIDDQLFFGLEKLNFTNNVKDPSFMREKLAYSVLANYMAASRTAFAIITLGDTITGSDDKLVNALYTQVEQVDEIFLKKHFKSDDYNLYKSSDHGTTMGYISPNQHDYEEQWEKKTNSSKDWLDLIELFQKYHNCSDEDFIYEAMKLIDLKNCIRYFAFNMVNANFDSYTGSGRNIYLYNDEKAGVFKLIPWDFDQSFGMFFPGFDVITVDAFAQPNLNQRPFLQRILANDSLKKVYARCMKEMITGPASADSIRALAYKFKAVIDPFVQADSNKFYTYEQFITNIDSNLIIMEGPKKTVIPGVLPTVIDRAEKVLAQVEAVLPVLQPPMSTSFKGATLSCFYDVQRQNLTIQYYVSENKSAVTMAMYSLDGARKLAVNEGSKSRGFYTISASTRSLLPGMYLFSLTRGGETATRNILVVR